MRRHPTPSTRAKVTPIKWRLLGDVPVRLRRPLSQAELVEAYRKGGVDEIYIARGPQGDYLLASLPTPTRTLASSHSSSPTYVCAGHGSW